MTKEEYLRIMKSFYTGDYEKDEKALDNLRNKAKSDSSLENFKDAESEFWQWRHKEMKKESN